MVWFIITVTPALLSVGNRGPPLPLPLPSLQTLHILRQKSRIQAGASYLTPLSLTGQTRHWQGGGCQVRVIDREGCKRQGGANDEGGYVKNIFQWEKRKRKGKALQIMHPTNSNKIKWYLAKKNCNAYQLCFNNIWYKNKFFYFLCEIAKGVSRLPMGKQRRFSV
jgi:hypothetical protein